LNVVEVDRVDGREITEFGSERARVAPLTVPDGDAHVVQIRIEPGGVLGRHAGRADQLFVVIAGEGAASGGDGEPVAVRAGTAVYWAAGEEHETRSETGLTALVVESPRLVTRE